MSSEEELTDHLTGASTPLESTQGTVGSGIVLEELDATQQDDINDDEEEKKNKEDEEDDLDDNIPAMNQEGEMDRLEKKAKLAQLDHDFPRYPGDYNISLETNDDNVVCVPCSKCQSAIKNFTKASIYPRKKFFKSDKDLHDISTVGSTGFIILRVFGVDKRNVAFQRQWWKCVREDLVRSTMKECRNNASRNLKELIHYSKLIRKG